MDMDMDMDMDMFMDMDMDMDRDRDIDMVTHSGGGEGGQKFVPFSVIALIPPFPVRAITGKVSHASG